MPDPQTDTYYIAGILLRSLVRDPDAGYCLVEGLVGPGAGPPPNRHPADDEAFYVLDGTFEFGIGSETRIGKASPNLRNVDPLRDLVYSNALMIGTGQFGTLPLVHDWDL